MAVVLLAISMGGTFLLGCTASDGEACEADDECSSEYCLSGYCAGSECGETSDCEDGWSCRHVDPNIAAEIGAEVINYFGGDVEPEGYYRCFATCGHCPASHHCTDGAELCSLGAP